MSPMSKELHFSCGCGATACSASAEPLFRVLCHCSLCRKFQQAPFSDISVFRRGSFSLPPEGAVEFETLRPPPNVQRGRCRECGQPAVEVFEGPMMPSMVMVPADMFQDPDRLPEPSAHIFADGSIEPIEDNVKQYRGYLASQLAFFRLYLAGIRRR